ncbi:MAG: hypothetical protein II892_00325 [Fibrobacter sp.]|nr:hypothetical protein [Fibrobacter sp.]
MKYRILIPIILLVFDLPFAQLLPQKSEDPSTKIDRALIFKVDYNDDVEAPADTSKTIDQPARSTKKSNLGSSLLFINTLCATGMVLSVILDGSGSGCFVIPSKKLK